MAWSGLGCIKKMFQWFQGCDIIHARREYFLRIRYRRKVSALRNFPQAFPRPTVKGDIQLLGIEMQRKRGEKWNVNKNTEMLKICVNIHIEHLLCKWQFPPLSCLYNDFEEKIVEFNWIFKILMFRVLTPNFMENSISLQRWVLHPLQKFGWDMCSFLKICSNEDFRRFFPSNSYRET